MRLAPRYLDPRAAPPAGRARPVCAVGRGHVAYRSTEKLQSRGPHQSERTAGDSQDDEFQLKKM
jgi:hypothetical protein